MKLLKEWLDKIFIKHVKKIFINDADCLLLLAERKFLLSCCLAIKVYKTNDSLVSGPGAVQAALPGCPSPGSGVCFRQKLVLNSS